MFSIIKTFSFLLLFVAAFYLIIDSINSVKREIKHLANCAELNHNHLVFRVDCLNPALDKKKLFRDYLDKTDVPESVKEKIWNDFLKSMEPE